MKDCSLIRTISYYLYSLTFTYFLRPLFFLLLLNYFSTCYNICTCISEENRRKNFWSNFSYQKCLQLENMFSNEKLIISILAYYIWIFNLFNHNYIVFNFLWIGVCSHALQNAHAYILTETWLSEIFKYIIEVDEGIFSNELRKYAKLWHIR